MTFMVFQPHYFRKVPVQNFKHFYTLLTLLCQLLKLLLPKKSSINHFCESMIGFLVAFLLPNILSWKTTQVGIISGPQVPWLKRWPNCTSTTQGVSNYKKIRQKGFSQKVALNAKILNLRFVRLSQNQHLKFLLADFRYYRTSS